MERRTARREFLRLGATAGALAVAACTSGTTPAPSHSSAATDTSDFRMGVLLPDTAAGDSIRAGMRLYLQEVGAQAGGRRIVDVDGVEDLVSPAASLDAVRRLVEGERVELVAGCLGSTPALAVRDYVDGRRVPTLIAGTGAVALSRGRRSPYVYRTSYSNWQLGQPLGSVLVRRGIRRLALLSAGDSDGVELAAAVKESYTGQVVVEARMPAGGDYGAVMDQVNDAGPDAVCALLAGADAAAFLKLARTQLAPGIQVTGSGFLVEPDVLSAVGEAAPVGAVTGLHWAPGLAYAENRTFTAAFQRAYGRPADVYALQGFDTARVVVEALGAVRGRTADRRAFLRAISAVTFTSPRGRFRFDAGSNTVVDTLYVRQLEADPGQGLANKVVGSVPNVADPGR
jgi:branched-chain amino acid transport system substrate-binding protein